MFRTCFPRLELRAITMLDIAMSFKNVVKLIPQVNLHFFEAVSVSLSSALEVIAVI